MNEPIPIGSRNELLLDRYLIDETDGAKLRLNRPERKEIALRMERPWEGPGSGIYSCVFREGDIVRMYYRAVPSLLHHDETEAQFTCYAESVDGVHWERPELGLVEYQGSTRNNIVLKGRFAHNFSPFRDTNPSCSPELPYKAIAGHHQDGLIGFASPDGLRWERIRERPLLTDGAFDSHNLAFWDENRGRYVCYSRYFHRSSPAASVYVGVRSIQSSESDDFLHWGPQRPNRYDRNAPVEHFYTNSVIPCPGAEHIYLSFPMRFMPERNKVEEFPKVGVSDNAFLSSRDGLHWDREFLEAWAPAGPDPRNWTERSHIVARGIVETSPGEFSLYVNEHYEWDDARVRRLTLPRHRFASVRAGYGGGGFVTKPLTFEGDRLAVNLSTSAAGSVSVQVETPDGRAIPGFRFEDCGWRYGDELDHIVDWGGGTALSMLAGPPVRLRFALKDADVYAFRFERSAGAAT